ncbi:glycoside hydrolase/phage tail family protein [Poseidonocella sp. HB161398]|uniref:baseplate multidomain protein megatron n=1 Tax=Poseidonocella sp. HB161398 TaxID=2320855 RepID=UPI001109716A|nr:glycoside hydrolase/phage tail family protein [Poseidonocella sp. HB161398]
MATIVLGAIGASVGASIGGSVLGLSAAVLGRAAGAVAGRMIDQRLLGTGSQAVETGRVDRLRITSASEGTAVQQVYGRMRVPGQVIWSTRFREHKSKQKSGGKGAPSTTVTSYSYSISLAIALCEGEIADIGRIWADGKVIGRSQMDIAVYRGTEDQDPDPKIVATEGLANAPAYRGLAYVVISDLQLEPFGNRVPQFSFEVLRPAQPESAGEIAPLAQAVKAVAMMPGSGEYTLATSVVHYDKGIGNAVPANRNSPSGKSDFLTSMDQLDAELPNCGSALLVVSWFGNDLRCADCRLKPKVEQKLVGASAMPWEVSGLDRLGAEEVPLFDGRPLYGGTPADAAVMEAIAELNRRGKQVVFYPFILMEQLAGNGLVNPWWGGPEQPPLPWRGRITTSLAPGVEGSPDGTAQARAEVAAFFGTAQPSDFAIEGGRVVYSGPPEWSYRRFVLHYAHLCVAAGGIGAFVIGSEMRSLTQIRAENGSFPAVEEFCRLAAEVRQVMGAGTKLGYAADWSEYFGYSPSDGSGSRYFHLDPLWAHDDIDFIGIDNYMPLSDWRDEPGHADAHWRSIHNIDYLQANIEGGEGYDWYYASDAGRDAQERLPISDGAYGEPWVWRYKDIRSWWSLPHHERIGGVRQEEPTVWVPQSKPVWFTEFGCAAIDKGTNQPNKFLDPKSSESDMPYYSTGARDDLMQMQYVRAVQDYWERGENNPVSAVYGGPMIDMAMAHVWAWDARPYPYFPGLSNVWGDGENYIRGHWLNGRTAGRDLAEVVREICARSGVTGIDTSALWGYVRGYAFSTIDGARAALQPLMLAHGFDSVERDGVLAFRSRSGQADVTLALSDLAEHPEQDGDLVQLRQPEAELAGQVQITHVAADGAYEARTSAAAYPADDARSVTASDLNMSLTFGEAQRMAERWLSEARVSRDTVTFALPPSYINVTAGDVVEILEDAGPALYRIDRIEDFGIRLVEAVRVEPGVYIPGGGYEEGDPLAVPPPSALPFPVFLDLPLLTGSEDPYAPHLAVAANPWPGEVAVYSSASTSGYALNRVIGESATLGLTASPLKRAEAALIDRGEGLVIDLAAGELSGTDWDSLLNGANALAIGDGQGGDWEIFQFLDHSLDENGNAVVSNRLRGLQGTDVFMPDEWPAGSLVVLIDGAVPQVSVPSIRGLNRHYRIGDAGEPLDSTDYLHVEHASDAAGLRPYAPVSLAVDIRGSGTHQFTWTRRSRIGGDDWTLSELPLGEAQELYRVTVRSGGTEYRVADLATPLFNYTEAQRIADGLEGSYALEVAQVSELYGPGPARRIEVYV